MSDTTSVSGGTTPSNFSDASGAGAAFSTIFATGTTYTVFTGGGTVSVPGTAVLSTSGTAVTVSGSTTAVADTTSGSNTITSTTNTVIFSGPNDTVTASTGSTTLFGASSGTTTFSIGGSGSSVTGGSGNIAGVASSSNSTLVGGTGTSLFTVNGANNLVAAGQSGTTGVDLSQSAGGNTITTNPLGNSGTLIATLSNGADSVIGGGGASTITAGSGNDVFGFVNGHAGGSEVIIGFSSNDTLAFGGYGYSLTNAPTETVTSGSDVITLSDGTTITLVGVDHKLFS